jgi:hypothetical protein
VLVVNVAVDENRIVAGFTRADEQVPTRSNFVVGIDDPVHVVVPVRRLVVPMLREAPSRSEPAAFPQTAKAWRAATSGPVRLISTRLASSCIEERTAGVQDRDRRWALGAVAEPESPPVLRREQSSDATAIAASASETGNTPAAGV